MNIWVKPTDWRINFQRSELAFIFFYTRIQALLNSMKAFRRELIFFYAKNSSQASKREREWEREVDSIFMGSFIEKKKLTSSL